MIGQTAKAVTGHPSEPSAACRQRVDDDARPRQYGMAASAAVAVLLVVAIGGAGADVGVAPFSAGKTGGVPAEPWHPTKLPKVPRETRYLLVDDAGTTVLRAQADASMSGLSHSLRIDPKAKPIIEWRWKVSGVLAKSAFGTKAGDDFAARVYVLFDYDTAKLPFGTRMKLRLARSMYGEAVPTAGLCYVWDSTAPVGTVAWSAYTDRLRMIVVTSGAAQAGQWVSVRRNVADDFRAAFGEDAPAISGVAIATDTDNTGETVTAWYGDIGFPGQAMTWKNTGPPLP